MAQNSENFRGKKEQQIPKTGGNDSLIRTVNINRLSESCEMKKNKSIHKNPISMISLKENELKFLELCCTEKTYKEIANDMFVSPRTIDGYRDRLFDKLSVKSRTGLVVFAIKQRIFNLGD